MIVSYGGLSFSIHRTQGYTRPLTVHRVDSSGSITQVNANLHIYEVTTATQELIYIAQHGQVNAD